MKTAVRSSSEGVILLPAKKSEVVYELRRLNEIALALRVAAAKCFVARAIETMEPTGDPDQPFAGVPEGQAKLRARVSPDGQVLRTEWLDEGFSDPRILSCVERAVQVQTFPPQSTNMNQFIDVVYWASLGIQPDLDDPAAVALRRREVAEVEDRARGCLKGTLAAGHYVARGLNLVGADGVSLGSRIDQNQWSDDTRACVARVLRDLRLPPAEDTFVRPVTSTMNFDVSSDGTVAGGEGEWLRLVRLEEMAERAQKRAELLDDEGEGPPTDPSPRAEAPALIEDEDERVPTTGVPSTIVDPGQAGLKLELLGGPRTP